MHRPRRRAVRLGAEGRPPRLLAGGRRALEAAREHLPFREHRARERDRAALRPDGDRHLGGRGRRLDEAIRVHALRAGPRARRPLHPDRSLLPHLEGAGVRLHDALHRAGRRGEPEHAVLLPLADLAGTEPRQRALAEGVARARARRRVQGRHRRHARVAGAEADRAAPERGRRGRLPRPARARAAGVRTRLGRARAGRLRLRHDRDGALLDRLRPRGGGRADRRRPAKRHGQGRPREPEGLQAVTRVGVAGLGYWGPNLARNFDELAELAWICDLSPELLAKYAGRYPQARGTTDFAEMLADAELDAVVIATPV